MLHTLSELGKGSFAVRDVQHERGIGDMGLDLVGGDAQMGCGTPHVAYDACAVCTALHQRLPDVEQDFHFVVERSVVILRCALELCPSHVYTDRLSLH